MPIAEVSAGVILIAIVLVALPVGAIVFAMGAGNALKEIGKGDFAIEQEPRPRPGAPAPAVSGAVREEEIRQMVQARSDRAVARGEKARDVESEVAELLASQRPSGQADPALREEVRGLVIARNERRQRQGKKPLDVEAEIDRQLDELENLGQ